MSKTVDERVVSMQFDNKQFEANVSTTMSSIDKLKQKLNFTGATKGFESIDRASKNVNMSVLGSAVEQVHSRFSALEVMGVTALANITNSAVNAGKRMLAALTIDPIKTGLSEYETKMNAVQVIKANTRSKYDNEAEQMEAITAALEELNTYADQTIYNFAQMTDNVGKFVAQGLDVDEAAKAVQGLANLAGASGASAQDMARATYQMSQALGGTIRKIDWNSLRNANMATVELKNTLMDLARVEGIDIDSMIEEKGTFEDTLEKGWLTGALFTEAMNIYSDVYSEAELKARGFTDEQVANFKELAHMAQEATVEVKTFSQLWDVLKETAQSGWTQTWELIFGDFNESKKFFTGLQVTLSGFIDGMSKARNKVLGGALNSKWDNLLDKITEAGVSAEDFQEVLKDTAREHGIAIDDLIEEYGSLGKVISSGKISKGVIIETIKKIAGYFDKTSESVQVTTDNIEHFQELVRKVIRGDYGNGEDRMKSLTKIGEDYATVQGLVNKVWERTNGTWSDCTITADDLADVITGLSEAELKSMGYTEEQAAALKKLAKQAEETGTPINQLIEDLAKPSGRELLLDSIYNIIEAIRKPLAAIKDAWNATFSKDDLSNGLYKIIEGINQFTEKLIMSEEACENFKKIFEGIFAGIQIAHWGFTASLTTSLKILNAVLGLFDMNLMDLGAKVADWIIQFRDWVKENTIMISGFNNIAKIIKPIVEGIGRMAKAFWELKPIQEIVTSIKEAIGKMFGGIADGMNLISFDKIAESISNVIDKIVEWIKTLENSENLGADIIAGIIEGLKIGIGSVVDWIVNIADTIVETFCKVLGIESPSKVFIALGGFIISGLLVGLVQNSGAIGEFFKNIGGNLIENGKAIVQNILDGIKGFDWSKVSAVLWSVSAFLPNVSILNIMAALTNVGSAFGVTLTNGVKSGVEKASKATTFINNLFTDIVSTIKTVISKVINFVKGIDLGAVISVVLSVFIYKLVNRIADIAEMFGAIPEGLGKMFSGIGKMMTDFGQGMEKFLKGKAFHERAKGILDIAIAIGILAASVAVLAQIPPKDLWGAVGAVGALSLIIVGLMFALNKLSQVDIKSTAKLLGSSIGILAFTGALTLMAVAMKKLSSIETDKILPTLGLLAGMLVGLGYIMKKFGQWIDGQNGVHLAKAGVMMLAMSAAMYILVGVINKISELTNEEIIRAGIVMAALEVLMAGILIVSRVSGGNILKAGITLMAMAGAFTLLIGLMKIISLLTDDELKRGISVIAALELLFAGLMAVSHLAGKNAVKAGTMILAISVSLLILSGAMKAFASVAEDGLADKCLGIIAVLEILIAGLIGISHFAGKNAAKAGLMIVQVAFALLLMSGVLFILSNLPTEGLGRALGIVTVLSALFAGLIYATKGAQDCMKTLVVLTVAIGVLAGVLIALTFLAKSNSKEMGIAAASLAGVMIGFATMIAAMSKIPEQTLGKALKTLIPLVLITAALGGIIVAMSFIPNPDTALKTAIGLSVLLEAFAAAMFILANAGSISPTVMPYLKSMIGVAMGLGVIVMALSYIGDPEKAIVGTLALSILLEAFAAAMFILAYSGSISTTIMPYLTPMIGVAMGLGAIVIALSTIENPQGALISSLALSELLIAFSGAIAILSFVGPKAASAIAAMKALGILVAATAGVLAICGGLMKENPNLNEFLQNGIPILETLGYAIGSFVGSIIGGFSAGAMSGLPAIGEYLSGFMESATGFIDGLEQFDNGVLKNIGVFMAMMIAMNQARIFSMFSQWMTRGIPVDGISKTVEEISEFVDGMVPICKSLKDVDANAIESLSTLAKMLLIVTAADFLNALTAKIPGVGQTGLGSFGMQLTSFGRSIVEFSKVITEGGINQEAVLAAAAAGEIMATLQSKLVGTGGVIQFFKGEKNLEEFGNQLVPFGRAIVRFSKAVSPKGSIDQNAVEAAKLAGETMAALQSTIPTNGWSFKKLFIGEQNLEEFGNQLVGFGLAMVRFSNVLISNGGIDSAAVENAKNAGLMMSDFSNTIPENGFSMKKIWSGEQNIGEFGNQLVQFGIAMTRFSNTLVRNGGVDNEAIESAKNAGAMMAALQETLPEDDLWTRIFGVDGTMETFGKGLVGFGESIVDFSKTVSGNVDESAITKIARVATDMVYVANNIPKKIDLTVFGDGLTDLATAVIEFSKATSGNVDLATVTTVANVGRVLSETAAIMPSEVDFARITTGLTTFGEAIVDFSAVVKSNIDDEAVTNATGLGKGIVEMVQGIPTDLDLATFSSNLSGLADAIVSFSNTVSGEGAIDRLAIESASLAGSTIATFLAEIPPFIEAADFIDKLPAIAEAIELFSEAVKEGIDADAILNATTAGGYINTFLTNIPAYAENSAYTNDLPKIAEGIVGFYKTFVDNSIDSTVLTNAATACDYINTFMSGVSEIGNADPSSYTEDLPAIAEAIKSFSGMVTEGVDADAITRVSKAGLDLNKWYAGIPSSIDVTSFVDGLPKVGTALKDFSAGIADITFPDTYDITQRFAEYASNVIGGFTSTVDSMTASLNQSGANIAKAVSDGIESEKREFKTAGKRSTNSFVSGATGSTIKKDAKEAFEALAKACRKMLDSETMIGNFASAGENLTIGFANGMTDNTWRAEAAAEAMAKAAKLAAEIALGIKSPSRELYKDGKFAVQGFVNALNDYTSDSYDAGYDMATSAKDGLRRAMNNIGSIIGSDMDTQPTIRPVVDLSEVRASTKDILNMLNLDSSVGVVPNVKAISTVMNRKNQNGANDDVVDAIGKLRKDIGNVNNTTYSINGITYNSDSDVGEAIETLVRAIRIEGRV